MSDELHPARDWPEPDATHDMLPSPQWGCAACGATDDALVEPCPNSTDPGTGTLRGLSA